MISGTDVCDFPHNRGAISARDIRDQGGFERKLLLVRGLACGFSDALANREMASAEQWRELYRAAMEGFDPATQKPLIDRARTAIFNRLLDLCDLSDSHEDEERLLEEALRQLWIAEDKNRERN